LFLIFISIVILICGVVLLTHKKPATPSAPSDSITPLRERRNKTKLSKGSSSDDQDGDGEALNPQEDEAQATTSHSQGAAWQVGDATDDEDDDTPDQVDPFADPSRGLSRSPGISAEEGRRLMNVEDDHEDVQAPSMQNNTLRSPVLRAVSPVSAPTRRTSSPNPRHSDSSDATLARQGSEDDEFGEWKAAEETSS
jgi:magnesium transporter